MGSLQPAQKPTRGRTGGKVNAHLAEKLQAVKWGEFRIGDLFEIKTSKKRFDANKVTILDNGNYPYVVRTALNNGIRGYLNEDKIFLNEGNTISFGQDTATMFYQEKPYFTGDKIKVLKAKDGRFNKKNAQFIISLMARTFSTFSWGSSSFNVSAIEEQLCSLPITATGEIDFVFMEDFIAELEASRIAELEAYLIATGLSSYQLTENEKEIIEIFNKNVNWKEFKIIDLFYVKNTSNVLSRDITPNSGKIPYLCASKENNAISSYITHNEQFLDKGNCIFIGGKTFVVTYQEYDFYSNDSHNLCLYLQDKEQAKKQQQLFMIASIEKGLSHLYSWGDSISNKKIQKDKIMLPEINGQPDYDTMQTLISAVQKLVIKDVVDYAERKMQAYRHIVQ